MKPLKKNSSCSSQVTIHYITGQLSLQINTKTTGKELFTQVCCSLGVKKFEYFGLQYEGKKKRVGWLRPGKKVHHVIGNYGTTPLFFLVKYFPEEIGKLGDNVAISLIYNQCKKEIVAGTIFCPPETSILLASYVLQAEEGDWAHVDHYSIEPGSMIPGNVLSQYTMSPIAWGDSLKDWHKDHEGLTPIEAQIEYLKIAQYLGMYGVSYFKAKNGGEMVWIGIHPKGINIYQETLLFPKTILKWVFIKMVHYSCKKFIVRLVLETVQEYVFQMKNMRTARLIFELAVGYHHLHVQNRYLPTQPSQYSELEKEKFKETTEELHSIETTKHDSIIRKIKKRNSTYIQLPTLKEEDISN